MSAPTYDQAVAQAPSADNAVAGLKQNVSELAPLAQTYHAAPTALPFTDYQQNGSSSPSNGGPLPTFAHFMGGLISQGGDIAATAGKWLAQQTANMATAPIRYGASLAHGIQDNYDVAEVNARRQQLNQVSQNVTTAYKAGQISKEQYAKTLNDLSQEYDNLGTQARATTNRFANDYQEAKQATIDTSAALLTVLTGGFGKGTATAVTGDGLVSLNARTAGSYLASGAAKTFFGSTEDALKAVAAHPQLFDALAPGVKAALQNSMAEVLSTGATMTSGQIARAAAVNLALKYPITYWYAQSTASDLYHELDQAKYGDATRTAAFNAALLLSGGPIGYALKWLGKGAGALVSRTFTRSAFIDELSKGIGDGKADGLWSALTNLTNLDRFKFLQDGKLVTLSKEEAQKRIAANLSALERTNMAAAGSDPVAAAWRVLKGMASYEGLSMKQFTPEEALLNMSNFAEAQRAADAAGKDLGKRITVGRVDVRELNNIGAAVTAPDKAAEGLASETVSTAPEAVDMSQAPSFLQPEGTVAKTAAPTVLTEAGQTAVTRPNGDIQTQIEQLMNTPLEKRSPPYDFATQAVQLAQKLPPQDAASELRNLTIDGKNIGNEFYKAAVDPQTHKISLVLKDAAVDPLKMTPEEVAAKVGFAPTAAAEPLSLVDQRLQAFDNLIASSQNKAWAHNDNFIRQIKGLIQKHEPAADLVKAISHIKASRAIEGLPSDLTKTLSDMGYLPIQPANLEAPFTEGTGKVASSFAQANNDVFLKTVKPVPILSWLGGVMSKAGLSPYASTERVYQLFNDNLARNLQLSGIVPELRGASLSNTTDTIIKQLSDYMHNPTEGSILSRAPVTDLRMLTTRDIMKATGMVASDARAAQAAIARSFIQVPLAVRGLGDRAVDLAYGLKGANALYRRYLRIQGALRFSWNPFFQYLRLIPKTEMLSEFEGGGFVRSLFAGRLGAINDIRAGLRTGGFLEAKGELGSVISGEATDFAGSMGRNLTHQLLPAQEASIAGLVDAQAERMGMDWKTYISTYPDQVRDTIQTIAQYDKHSQILNSPLMRTLNIAFFPLRFDTKVATIMARSLGRASLPTQVAVLKGLYNFHNWMQTDQGKAWYAGHADAIGLFKYVTPVAHLNELFSSLVPGHDHSLGNFGEVGGLPFGFITQLLDSEGITQFNQAGADPKTGQLYTKYLPATAKGQIAIAIQDLLGSLFSYPGATVGLPSKTKVTSGVANFLTGAGTKDYFKMTPTPTPEQLDYQQALQRSGVPGAAMPTNQGLGTGQPLTSQSVPGLPTSANVAPAPRQPRGSAKKKKKGEFTPELLPGQSQLGQL